MSLATAIVVVLAVLFFGGIILLEHSSRKNVKQDAAQGPLQMLPRGPAEKPPKEPAAPMPGSAVAFRAKQMPNKKKHARGIRNRPHSPGRIAS